MSTAPSSSLTISRTSRDRKAAYKCTKKKGEAVTFTIMSELSKILCVLKKIEVQVNTLAKRAARVPPCDDDEEDIEFSEVDTDEGCPLPPSPPGRKKRRMRYIEAGEQDAESPVPTEVCVKWHEKDGIYLAMSEARNFGEHRARWLKDVPEPASVHTGYSTWHYCDWPRQIVDSSHPKQHACSEDFPSETHPGGFFEFTAAASPKRFVIEPTLYEYDTLTETDFSPLLLYVVETLPEDTLGPQHSAGRIFEYRKRFLQIADSCYGSNFLVFSGTREIDREGDEEVLNSILEEPDRPALTRPCKQLKYSVTVCDACNRRKRCAPSFNGTCVTCDACHDRMEALHRLKASIPPKKNRDSSSEVFNVFICAFLDFKEAL